MTPDDLKAFEEDIAAAFERREVKGPIHLSGGNEDVLIEIFKKIERADWVLSTYRSHYHALLHGIDPAWLRQQILDGHSMNIFCDQPKFLTSAIVGGMLPIAVGLAAGLKRNGDPAQVWCFVGDMASTTGAFHEAHTYACANRLPLTFVVEDNGVSTNSPTAECWGAPQKVAGRQIISYDYERKWPHVGVGRFIQF